jgi:hypothetical protein
MIFDNLVIRYIRLHVMGLQFAIEWQPGLSDKQRTIELDNHESFTLLSLKLAFLLILFG